MKKGKTILMISTALIFLFSFADMAGQTKTRSTQSATKQVQTKTKSTKPAAKPVAKPAAKPAQTNSKSLPVKKVTDAGTIVIGKQSWSITNLNVSTFRNGDSIPEARSNKEWVAAGDAGKPAWCYYNNDPALGLKYGKLYNWYAVNDPRGLAPNGWSLPSDEDWAELSYFSGGDAVAGIKLKTLNGWKDGNNGTNETGFGGLPGGYRIENGLFLNIGSIGVWWSSTESKSLSAIDCYLSMNGNLSRSSTPRQRGESVRCIKK